MENFLIMTIQVNLWPFWGHTFLLQLGCFGLDIVHINALTVINYDIVIMMSIFCNSMYECA